MNRLVRDQLLISLAAVVVFCTNLGATALWDLDEPLYASCAREMLNRGDWVVPMYNGEPFFDKPPLMFWLMMSGFSLFGQTEFAARFWSPVIGLAIALATYHLGRLLFRREVGFWAGLATTSTIIFTVSARAATVDAALTLATTLAVLCFVLARRRTGVGSWLWFALMYACLGLAVLAKGPIGLLLPAAAIGLYMLIVNRQAARGAAGSPVDPASDTPPAHSAAFGGWLKAIVAGLRSAVGLFAPGNFLRSLWQLRPLTGLLVVAAVALPWYVLVGLRTDGAWLEQFFAKYNLRPFVQPFMGHRGPFYYHFVMIVVGFFPWSLLLAPTLAHAARQIRQRTPWADAATLLACWVGVWFAFWSVCSTKLPHYVLPCYPALALLTGAFVADWLAEPARFRRCWSRNAAATLIAVGVSMAVALPIVAHFFVPGEEIVGLVGLIPLAGGLVCWHYHARGRLAPMMAAFAVTAVALLTGIFAFAAVRVDRHQHSEPLLAEIRAASPAPQIAAYRFLDASMVYYAGQTVPRYEDAGKLRQFVDHAPDPFVLTLGTQAEQLQQLYPGEFRIVARRPRFLRGGEVVVLGRNAAVDPARTARKMTVQQR